MFMKKTIITIILATIIGFTFGLFFLKKLNTETITEVSNIKSQVYAFQIGVYKNRILQFAESSESIKVIRSNNVALNIYLKRFYLEAR